MNRPIALLTDFGTKDWFAASMKGAILGVNPRAVILDVTHDIPRGNIPAAAFSLFACHTSFPKGTVFAVIVDPGVGSTRAAIAVFAGGYFFVGPDNGVLSVAVNAYPQAEIRELRNSACFRKTVSPTFHGRDIFAPVAARISKGFAFWKLGPKRKGMECISMPVAKKAGKQIKGMVMYIDGFGNCITNVPTVFASRKRARLRVRNRSIPICPFYADVGEGKPLAVAGSCGFIEVSVNQGNAAKELRLKVGDTVSIR